MNPFRCRHSRPLAVALLLGVGAAHATAQTPVMDGAPKYAGGALPGSATDSAAKLLALADTNAAHATRPQAPPPRPVPTNGGRTFP